ncbi:MAG TPA: M56 family metallopeptidase [Candidatus Sulfotelmatobacter sp.]|nr:M56 family metallopeptidase [Candidatus Sulfotelmatobacter sp.]
MISTLIRFLADPAPATMHFVGWSLVHFLWQGMALAGLAAIAMSLCRQASSRYSVGVVALVLMLLAPVATFWAYSHTNVGSFGEQSSANLSVGRVTLSAPARMPTPSLTLPPPHQDAFPWLVGAWLIGVMLFGIRSAGGFVVLERQRRKRGPDIGAQLQATCLALQNKMGIRRAVEYCQCAWMQTPSVVGWFRPIVFLPASALTGLSDEQLQLVIAHELAHIRRFDAFVNVFQVCVETVLFYHPAVWWLNKRIRTEREHCCDKMVVEFCGNAVEYARALTLMEEWRSAPVLAMAANRGPLTERVARLLGLKTFGSGARIAGMGASVLCLTAALAAGNALLGMARPQFARVAAASMQTATESAPSAPSVSAKPSPSHRQTSSTSASNESSQSVGASSYIDQMKSAGLGDLTVDQLIALKTQDVSPDYVRELRGLGLNLDVNKVIAMRIQDVTPEFIRELRDAGLNADEDQIISMKIQNADAAYYRELKDAGIQCDVNRLISMKIQDVTGAYVRELRAAGLKVNADQAISLKIQDVTPAYLKELHEQGIDPSTEEAISMRIQDVTPDYVRQIHALGLKPSTEELVSMRIQDVTPEYVKALQSAGFNVNVEEIIGAKIQDVTPEFIEQARKHGFKDLTLQKLIQLRQLGILDAEQKADL